MLQLRDWDLLDSLCRSSVLLIIVGLYLEELKLVLVVE